MCENHIIIRFAAHRYPSTHEQPLYDFLSVHGSGKEKNYGFPLFPLSIHQLMSAREILIAEGRGGR